MTKKNDAIDILAWAANRATTHAFFLANYLAQYQALQNMADAQLADFLGCTEEKLRELALCRRPDPSAPAFKTEVELIATYAGVKSARLAELIRHVEALAALTATSTTQHSDSLLMAARDRGENREDQDSSQADSEPES